MSYQEIVASVASELGVSSRLVDRAYRAYWKAVREHITTIPMKEDISDATLLSLRPNVNIPSIGKLYVNIDRYKRLKENYSNNQKKESR